MTELRLDGKVLIVTGGTQGVGEAIARAAADSGAAGILVTGRNRDRGARVAAVLARNGCAAHFHPAELGEEAQCRAVAAEAERRFGHIDGLVNAAGLTDRGTLDGTTVELWERLFNVNVYFQSYLPMTLDQAAEIERWRKLGIRTVGAPPEPALLAP